jgi:hypothetical protein
VYARVSKGNTNVENKLGFFMTEEEVRYWNEFSQRLDTTDNPVSQGRLLFVNPCPNKRKIISDHAQTKAGKC